MMFTTLDRHSEFMTLVGRNHRNADSKADLSFPRSVLVTSSSCAVESLLIVPSRFLSDLSISSGSQSQAWQATISILCHKTNGSEDPVKAVLLTSRSAKHIVSRVCITPTALPASIRESACGYFLIFKPPETPSMLRRFF